MTDREQEIRARCEAATPGQTHELKCWPEYFQAVKSGEKTFEVRKWDRPYHVGDTLRLREYDPEKLDYTGDEIMRVVTYLLDMTYLPGDNIPHFAGYVVMGLKDPETARLRADLAAMTAERDAMRERAESAFGWAEMMFEHLGNRGGNEAIRYSYSRWRDEKWRRPVAENRP